MVTSTPPAELPPTTEKPADDPAPVATIPPAPPSNTPENLDGIKPLPDFSDFQSEIGLEETVKNAIGMAERIEKQCNDLESQIQVSFDKKYDELRYLFAGREGTLTHDEAIRLKIRAENVTREESARLRAGVLDSYGEDLEKRIKILSKMETLLRQHKHIYPSPSARATLFGINTPDRERYHNALRYSGAAELQQAAYFALATNNRILAAAVLHHNQRIERRSRLFSSQDLARRLWGTEHEKLETSYTQVNSALQRAILARRRLASGQRGPLTDRINNGLLNRSVERAVKKPAIPPLEGQATPTERIANGLKQRGA